MSETLKYVSDAGEIALATGDVLALVGVGGRGMPPVEVTERQLASGAGSIATRVRDSARVIPIPVFVSGELRQVLRASAAVLDPTVEGKLVAENAVAGWSRELPCRYVGGFEWDERSPDHMWQVPEFKAFDPYWRDTEPTTDQIEQGDRGPWLPFLPIRVIADDVFGEFVVNNDGDVEAWPVWTITGPADTVTLAADSGDTLKVAYSLAAGETLTIDTRPAAKTVTDQDGTNRFSSLDTDLDDLFGFPTGTTIVAVTIQSATEASRVAVSWLRLWRTA